MTDSNKPEKSKSLVPGPALLDAWSGDTWTNGIEISELEPLETVAVDTMNHTYEITIIDPATAEVLVRGGEVFPERRLARVNGATLRGSFLKLHGIYVGFNLEFLVDGSRITTSRVRRISILKASDVGSA